MKNKHMGSTFDSFLEEEGIKAEVDLRVTKKILADQIRARMERTGVSVAELARRMKTSRTVVIRLLEAKDTSFTFNTLAKASWALGMELVVSLAAKAPAKRRSAGRARAA